MGSIIFRCNKFIEQICFIVYRNFLRYMIFGSAIMKYIVKILKYKTPIQVLEKCSVCVQLFVGLSK